MSRGEAFEAYQARTVSGAPRMRIGRAEHGKHLGKSRYPMPVPTTRP